MEDIQESSGSNSDRDSNTSPKKNGSSSQSLSRRYARKENPIYTKIWVHSDPSRKNSNENEEMKTEEANKFFED